MSVKLSIEITSPLDPDDRDLLSGVAIMTLAIANHELAKEHFPETFPDDEVSADSAPAATPCAFLDPDGGTRICIADAGHRGRHRFRTIGTGDAEAVTSRAN